MSSDTQPTPQPQTYLPPTGPIRRFVPRSLYARAALILIVPVVALQLVVSVTVTQRLYEDVTRQMTRSLAAGLGAVVRAVEAAPDAEAARQTAAALAAPAGVVTILPAEGPLQDNLALSDLSGRTVIGTLRAEVPGIRGVDLTAARAVLVAIDTRHGLLGVEFDRRRVAASNPHQLLVLTAFTSLLMTGVAFLFLRNQLRPIRRLALAAEAFGRGRMVPYRPSGAVEVRSAGSAFLDMRARIERQIEQRTLMLSGVSHDLRTPLTRLKLSLAMMPEDEDTKAMERDIAEMQALIDAFLAFARGDALESEPELVDPLELLREIAARAARAGQPVSEGVFEGTGRMPLRTVAISRAVENLIGNAVRYGRRAEVGALLTDRALVISVEDDGPGIPRGRRDEALRPFSRLDPARNQDSGSGVGLGLAIAADVARSHGGTLRLGESARLGGLKAELVLPR
ncbi:ATP-binding protein [Frigidibacter sp.]|uniref:ATP-binding protein n=1 Tax=Frigidibacter sp. TaxID=2586418 RepID=UPI00273643F9|nr:ATP-binding protein [Frigidibacter sp.]MDP3340349.1 ATP-binding protein [Frigidibacter sp.]